MSDIIKIVIGAIVLIGIVVSVIFITKFIHNNFSYDKDGYNKNGYDRKGFNRSGYNKFGFNQNGFNKYGFDRFGYNMNGYNNSGLDKSGLSVYDYQKILLEMNTLHNKAYEQMKKCAFGYALHDIRIGLEKGVKCVICHLRGIFNVNNSLDDNITVSKYYGLMERDFIERLYDAKNHCNDAQHDSNIKKEYNQVYFCYKVLEELIDIVQALCLCRC